MMMNRNGGEYILKFNELYNNDDFIEILYNKINEIQFDEDKEYKLALRYIFLEKNKEGLDSMCCSYPKMPTTIKEIREVVNRIFLGYYDYKKKKFIEDDFNNLYYLESEFEIEIQIEVVTKIKDFAELSSKKLI